MPHEIVTMYQINKCMVLNNKLRRQQRRRRWLLLGPHSPLNNNSKEGGTDPGVHSLPRTPTGTATRNNRVKSKLKQLRIKRSLGHTQDDTNSSFAMAPGLLLAHNGRYIFWHGCYCSCWMMLSSSCAKPPRVRTLERRYRSRMSGSGGTWTDEEEEEEWLVLVECIILGGETISL